MTNSMLRNAGLLALFALVCTLLVSLVNLFTKPLIAEQNQLQTQKLLDQLLPAGSFDNIPALDCAHISADMLGGESVIYRAYKDNQPVAAVLEATAPDGYSGKIHLLIAISTNETMLGVRTLSHKETPGLGDKIELAKSDWILSFDKLILNTDNDSRWAVKKDGGQFDQFTGATITPRAVVKAAKTALLYFKAEQSALFAYPNQCEIKP